MSGAHHYHSVPDGPAQSEPPSINISLLLSKDRRVFPSFAKPNETELVMTLNFGDAWERDLYDLSIRTKHLDAGCGEGLRCLHAAYGTSYPATVSRDDLDVLFAVKGLQCCQSFSNFHCFYLSPVDAFGCAEILPCRGRHCPIEAESFAISHWTLFNCHFGNIINSPLNPPLARTHK